MTSTRAPSRNGLTRRHAVGLALAAAAPLGARAPRAQEAATLRWMTSQTAPTQRAAYEYQIKTFQEANPGVRVVIEQTSDGGYPAQLAAAFASKQVPNLITHLPSFAVANYWRSGLLEPVDGIVDAIGREKYFEGANAVYELSKGQLAGTGIGNTAADMLWVRRDLLKRAEIDRIPETWDELRDACRKMQGRGVYGAPLPYGKNSMTSSIFIGFLHRAGGEVFTPDLQVALRSDAAVNALEFYKSMREFCPPGATSYQWGESINAFVTGATATGIYSGRVIQNVNAQNPKIKDEITCRTYPTIARDVPAWTFNNFPSVFLPKDAPNLELTKRFVVHLFRPDGYIKQMLAAPGHILPVLKTIATDPAYVGDPLLTKYRSEIELMSAAAAKGHNLGLESPRHQANLKAGEVTASDILGELVQRVCLNGEAPRAALDDAATRIEAIMKG